MRAYFITIVIASFATFSQAGLESGPITNPTNGHTYYLLTNNNWTGSQAEAVTLGGNLVTINDVDENTWVNTTFSQFGEVTRSLWIGLNDVASEGDFVWASGEPLTYTNWPSGQPDNVNNEDYTYMGPSGGWNDGQNGLWGGYNLYGVVEIVPEPTSLLILGAGSLLLLSRKEKQ